MKTILASLIFISTLNHYLYAQPRSINISGRVVSFEESLALEGVAVTVKGTDKTTGTQSDGIFYITISEKDKTLVVSLEGYEPKEIELTGNTDYQVVLKRNDSANELSNKNRSANNELSLTYCNEQL
ncbi:MAG: carboxypeptidase-like regulatory domain-containing protein [Ferruginibacter sp.]